MARELTREEKAAIRKLVTRLCANYDRDVGCLPLELSLLYAGEVLDGCAVPLLPGGGAAQRSRAGGVPSLRKALSRKPGPARYAAGLFSPMAGHGIVLPDVAKAARHKKQRDYMRKYRS